VFTEAANFQFQYLNCGIAFNWSLAGLEQLPVPLRPPGSRIGWQENAQMERRFQNVASWSPELARNWRHREAFLQSSGVKSCLPDCEANSLDGSGGSFSEEVFELGKDLFDGVQVG